jgi:hypothetical protein
MPSTESNALVDVLLEHHPNFDIYWYHWPYDGWFRSVHDYEPVILVYNDDCTLCCVIVRRGWEYKHYEPSDLDPVIEIIFKTSFHHPFAKIQMSNLSEEVETFVTRAYAPRQIISSDITTMFRTGQGHPTLTRRLGIPVKDPSMVAQHAFSEYCPR